MPKAHDEQKAKRRRPNKNSRQGEDHYNLQDVLLGYKRAETMNFAINDIRSDLWLWIIFPILSYVGYLLLKWAVNTFFSWDD